MLVPLIVLDAIVEEMFCSDCPKLKIVPECVTFEVMLKGCCVVLTNSICDVDKAGGRLSIGQD